MRGFGDLGGRFFVPLVIDDTGVGVRGSVTRPAEGDLSGDVAAPRVMLRVRRNSIVQAGMVIRTRSGQRYIVGEHADVAADYRAHKLFPCNRQVVWKRGVTTKDPLTKQDKTVYDMTMGTIWVNWELIPREELDVNLRVLEDRSSVFTTAAVQLNDSLDGQVVKRLNHRLGILALEVQ